MRFAKLAVTVKAWSNIQEMTILLLVVFLSSGCSTVSIEAARALSVTGRDVVIQAQQNVRVSDKEYLRARDTEALLHGFSGTVESKNYTEILRLYNDIHRELAKRSVVFEKFADVYDAFGDLAGLDASEQTETALGNLGSAINEYATLLKKEPPISIETTGVISKIGGLVAAEVQKAKIKEASGQIRDKVGAFLKLLELPLVREQIKGFKQFLASDRKAAIAMLWDAGVYDPKPLLDDIGADAGLVAQKDATRVVTSNPDLKRAIGEVIDKRLAYKIGLIEQGYDVSLVALKRLIAEHEKLEQGEKLDLIRLREIVSQLRGIVVLLAKPKAVNSISQ